MVAIVADVDGVPLAPGGRLHGAALPGDSKRDSFVPAASIMVQALLGGGLQLSMLAAELPGNSFGGTFGKVVRVAACPLNRVAFEAASGFYSPRLEPPVRLGQRLIETLAATQWCGAPVAAASLRWSAVRGAERNAPEATPRPRSGRRTRARFPTRRRSWSIPPRRSGPRTRARRRRPWLAWRAIASAAWYRFLRSAE